MAQKNNNRTRFEADLSIKPNKAQDKQLGYTIVVHLRNGVEKTKFGGKPLLITRIRDKKIIFIPTDVPIKDSRKIGNIGGGQIGFRISDAKILPDFLKFSGDYALQFDNVRKYYYIDIENQSGEDNIINMMNGTTVPEVKVVDDVTEAPEPIKRTNPGPLRMTPEEADEDHRPKNKAYDAVPRADWEAVKKDLADAQEYAKLLEKDVENLKAQLSEVKASSKKALDNVKQQYKDVAIAYLRELLDDSSFKEAQIVNDTIKKLFE